MGYAGLIAYDDEAHVATLGVTGARRARASARCCSTSCSPRPTGAARSVLLEVRADNEAAQRLYRRRGFAEIGRRRGYYQPSGETRSS